MEFVKKYLKFYFRFIFEVSLKRCFRFSYIGGVEVPVKSA